MLVKILGYVWALSGLFWLIWPGCLKWWLMTMTGWKIRRLTFGVMLLVGVMMVGSLFRIPGTLSKILMVVGMLLTIKAVRLITSRAAEGLTEWWAARSMVFFRLWALGVLAVGISMVMV